jgi:hypothetical protein
LASFWCHNIPGKIILPSKIVFTGAVTQNRIC